MQYVDVYFDIFYYKYHYNDLNYDEIKTLLSVCIFWKKAFEVHQS